MSQRPMICTDGKVRRLHLNQPPHFGSGSFVRMPVKQQVIAGGSTKAHEKQKEMKK